MKSDLHLLYHFFWVPLRATVKYVFFIASCFVFLSICIYSVSLNYIFDLDIFKANQEDIATILNYTPKDNTKIFDRNGNLISEQFNQYHVYIPYAEIPKDMVNTILAIEDRKFFKHKGIDVYGVLRALYTLHRSGRIKQGASTITQQIVKNLLLSKEKTLKRKIREIVLAIYIEQNISKEKILEIYCNHIFLGHGSYGIGAAAKRYFNKNVNELEKHEMALIAGLFQSPGKYNPMKNPHLAKKRQKAVLLAMHDAGFITKDERKELVKTELAYTEYESMHGKVAPYYVDYIIEESQKILADTEYDLKGSGLRVYTSLNQNLQNLAQEAIAQSDDVFKKMDKNIIKDSKIVKPKDLTPEEIEAEKKKNLSEAAMLVLDRRTGEIVSMVGGRDYKASQFNRSIHSLRAPGSVFKPITYALALKNGHNWNDQHYITPITVGNYRPRNSYSTLFTETTLLRSFYKSINSTAVEIGNKLGVKRVMRFARTLGIETPLKDEAATLLGSSEVNLLDMAKVYSTFANRGKRINPIAITKIEDKNGNIIYEAPTLKDRSKFVLNGRTNELLVEGLKQVVRRGTGYNASFLSSYAAGKTGTSNKSKDNWFCGFTNDLVIITWMGNDDQNSYRGYISASNTATVLWARFASKTRKLLGSRRLSRPRSIRMAHINPLYGNLDREAGIPMYFLAEMLPKEEKSDLLFLERGQSIRMDLNEF